MEKRRKMAEDLVFREIKGDLFTAPDDFALAHCVPVSMTMGAGIARLFKYLLFNLHVSLIGKENVIKWVFNDFYFASDRNLVVYKNWKIRMPKLVVWLSSNTKNDLFITWSQKKTHSINQPMKTWTHHWKQWKSIWYIIISLLTFKFLIEVEEDI